MLSSQRSIQRMNCIKYHRMRENLVLGFVNDDNSTVKVIYQYNMAALKQSILSMQRLQLVVISEKIKE